MSLAPKNLWLKGVLTVALATTPLIGMPTSAYAAGKAPSCSQQILDQCDSSMQDVANQRDAQVAGNLGGTKSSASNYSNAQNAAKINGNIAAGQCQDKQSLCDKLCKTDKDKKACAGAVADKATDMKAQSAANGDNGGSAGMMAGLMGAAAGAALGYMMAKKQQDDQPQPLPPPPVATGALQLNGALNCQMQDSYRYEDCNSFLTTYCASAATNAAAAAAAGTVVSATPVTGTVISSAPGVLPTTPDCASFNASFCSTQVTAPVPYGMQRSDGAVTQVNMAGSGEGLGSPYCSNAVASAWCSDALYGATRSTCPACRQMQTTQSPTCVANPALCMAQNSPQQLTSITDNTACQGDPLFTPGSPYAMPGVSGTNVAAGNTVINNSLPVVVLPSSVNPTANSGSGKATGGLPSTGGGIAVSSVGGGVNGPGMREGRALASTSGASGGSMGGSGAHASHVGPSELIAAGGVIVADTTATASRGPASDVEAQFGPSLFTTSSQVIRLHCQAGKLNNCP